MIPAITPPAEKSREIGWNSLSPIKIFLLGGKPKIVAGLTALTARQLFAQLERHMTVINTNLAAGLYDGDAQTKADAVSMLKELNAIVAVGVPIEKKYSERTGSLIATSAAAGTVLSIEGASGQIVFDQVDIDALAAAVNTALGA